MDERANENLVEEKKETTLNSCALVLYACRSYLAMLCYVTTEQKRGMDFSKWKPASSTLRSPLKDVKRSIPLYFLVIWNFNDFTFQCSTARVSVR